MATSRTSIFISHVNGDPDAEPVLHALVTGLKQELAPSHDAYEVVYDREIVAGREWRREIYGWLYDCPAAIVLVSEQALKDDEVWVAFEANYLSVDQIRRPEQCIIPVWLRGVDDQRIRNARNFKTGRFPDIQALRFPNPPGLTTLDELACAIAGRIKQELPARGVKRLVGLVAELCDKLSEFPKPAQNAAALVLDLAGTDTDAEHLAGQFLAADEIKVQQAFYALCDRSRHKQFRDLKLHIANILGAQLVREADAKPIAVEAAIPSAAGCGRALLLDSQDADIIDLYLSRAARRVPHAWNLNDGPSAQEDGYLDDLKKSVRKLVTTKFGIGGGRSEDMQLRRGNAIVGWKRRTGFPVLLKLDYPESRDPAATFRTIHEVCSELMVLYTASPETSTNLPADPAVCQLPPLGIDGYERVIGPYGALIDHCRTTTPGEEKPSS